MILVSCGSSIYIRNRIILFRFQKDKTTVMHSVIQALTLNEVKQLRDLGGRFGEDWEERKMDLLQQMTTLKINDVKTLIEYHDCLLFYLAYPENKELMQFALGELHRTAAVARDMFNGKNVSKRIQLTGTGIAFTQLNVAFSFNLVEWLVNRFPRSVSIFESGADPESVRETTSLFLQKSEQETFAEKKYSLQKFIQQAKGKSKLTDLQWLISFIRQKNLPPEIRDHIYDSLRLYISWMLDDQMPSRTFARSLPRKIFFHKKTLKREVDAKALIREVIPSVTKISLSEKVSLVETSRGILGMLLRETDPVTYADAETVTWFDMGRGIDIALYPMTSSRRLPFDCYIGYTAFKNRLPVAYGGAWIFQQRAKIGVNVLAPYRGGESAYLFCQVLRLYHHHYHVNRFVVEPYQIGKNNLEGLKSGAFWFYYRLGFLPVRESLISLSNKEFQKIQTQKGYRSSINIMRKLADSNLELMLSKDGHHEFDASFLSQSITQCIKDEFEGNRERAIAETKAQTQKFLGLKNKDLRSSEEQQSLRNFSLLLQVFTDLSAWGNRDKKELIRLVKEKGSGSERQYIQQFQKHERLNESLQKLWNLKQMVST